MSLTLTLDFQFAISIEQAWSALTESNKLAKWVAENDFKPIEGERFQFRHQASEYWDGIVNGEVIKVEKPYHLSYVWSAGGEQQTVNWTLQSGQDEKILLHLEQTGFQNEQELEGARYGWTEWFSKFEQALE